MDGGIIIDRGLAFVASARALAKRTAACIARCCSRCPGPVLRRKCDTWCPTCPNDQIPQGFYRIDLNAFVSPGVTWAQWIAQNDAALTPCRLIRFGTDPEACFVLDRNCSRCFIPASCPYVFNYAALPVATFQNPMLATCADCIACEQCCDSAIVNDCSRQICRHCGSTYNTAASGTSHSTITVWDTAGGIQRGVISNNDVTRDMTLTSTHVCTPANSSCNSSTMVVNWHGTTRSRVGYHVANGQNFDADYFASAGTDTPGSPDLNYVRSSPAFCTDLAALRTAIFAAMATDSTTIPINSTRDAILRTIPFGNIGNIGLGTGAFAQCSNSVFVASVGPFEGQYLREETRTWSVQITQTGGSFTFTHDIKVFVKPRSDLNRALQNWSRGEHSGTFSITRIDPCSPNAVANCPDLLVRGCGTREIGTGGVGPSGLAGDLL